MSDWDDSRLADERYDARPSWPDGTTYPYPLPFPLAQAVDGDELESAEGGQPHRSSYPWPPAPPPAWLTDRQGAGDPPGKGGRHREHGGRRWLIPAGVVAGAAALGGVAVLMTGGHPAPATTRVIPPSMTPSMMVTRATKAPTPGAGAGAPLTLTQAQAVLSRYTTTNNSANAQRSDAILASVESGSSYAIDAGLYQKQLADGTHYPAFGPVQATYYIPRDQPAGRGPRWFAVQVANAFQSSPATVTSDEYLLFTQSAAGGAWQETIEPYLLASASAPQVTVGSDGLATAVSPDSAAVAVAPSQLPAATAASLDGTGAGPGAVGVPGNLADRSDQKLLRAKVPGATVTDPHTAAAGADGQEFALLTADGGALVFYTDAARLTITAPVGSTLRLTVPGLYTPDQALTQAGLSYLEQFAAYDPPAGGGTPSVVADYSGITGKN
jgi:hypothetical protein